MSKRKPTWATIGSITDTICEPSPERDIDDMAFALRSLLRRCRVGREDRKAFGKLLHEIADCDDFVKSNPQVFARSHKLTDELTAALETFAPPHAWFGERAGEWGFWPKSLDGDVVTLRDNSGFNSLNFQGREAYLVNDHGNVTTCGRFDKRGRFTAYWSVV